ncbi:hypothetical protein pipiens_006918, partial [Culex pipiens pipiens]
MWHHGSLQHKILFYLHPFLQDLVYIWSDVWSVNLLAAPLPAVVKLSLSVLILCVMLLPLVYCVVGTAMYLGFLQYQIESLYPGIISKQFKVYHWFDLEYTEDSFFVITKDQLEEDLRNAAFECDVEELFQRIISWRKAKGADLFTFEAIDFYDDSEQDDFFATGNTSSFPDENDQTTASAVEAVTYGSTNITIPNTISQVEPSVPASGGLNKITSAVQPRESAPGGLHQTAASSVTAAGGVTSFISAPASVGKRWPFDKCFYLKLPRHVKPLSKKEPAELAE